MGKVADPMREFVETYLMNNTTQETEQWLAMTGRSLLRIADQIDREHERRMEQCRHETKRAFVKYLRQITGEYEHGLKRKSWTSQQRMQLELEALRVKEAKHENH